MRCALTFDEKLHLAGATRTVAASTRDGQAVRTVSLTRTYTTTLDDLWDAVTNPHRLPRWFAKVSGDLRLGGRFAIEGNASGSVIACDPPRFLHLTWDYGTEVSWVEVRLTEAGAGQATLTLTHIAPDGDHMTQFGPGAAGVGWEWSFMELARQMAAPGVAKFDEEAFAATDAGRAFVLGSSLLWGQAAIDGGESPVTATPAARRTAAFFLGIEEAAL